MGVFSPPSAIRCPPFSIKPPQDNFCIQNANCRPPKYKLSRGDFCVFLYKNCRLEVANLHFGGRQFTFGGCQFTFWRPKLSWGCFIEKGWSPKRVVLWIFVIEAQQTRKGQPPKIIFAQAPRLDSPGPQLLRVRLQAMECWPQWNVSEVTSAKSADESAPYTLRIF